MDRHVEARAVLAAAEHEDRQSRRMLTTGQCAAALGVSTQFIRGEIRDKRLPARVSKPEGRQRAKYRIDAVDFAAYRQQHWPRTA